MLGILDFVLTTATAQAIKEDKLDELSAEEQKQLRPLLNLNFAMENLFKQKGMPKLELIIEGKKYSAKRVYTRLNEQGKHQDWSSLFNTFITEIYNSLEGNPELKNRVSASLTKINLALLDLDRNETSKKNFVVSEVDWFSAALSSGALPSKTSISFNGEDIMASDLLEISKQKQDKKPTQEAKKALRVIRNFRKSMHKVSAFDKPKSWHKKAKKKIKHFARSSNDWFMLHPVINFTVRNKKRVIGLSASTAFMIAAQSTGLLQSWVSQIDANFSQPNEQDYADARERVNLQKLRLEIDDTRHPNAFCDAVINATPAMMTNLNHPEAQKFFNQFIVNMNPGDRRKSFLDTVMFAASYGLHPTVAASLGNKESLAGDSIFGVGSDAEGYWHYTNLKMAESVYKYHDEILEILRRRGHPEIDRFEDIFSRFDKPYKLRNDVRFHKRIRRKKATRYNNPLKRYGYDAETKPGYTYENLLFDAFDYSKGDFDDDARLIVSLRHDKEVMGYVLYRDAIAINPNVSIQKFGSLNFEQQLKVVTPLNIEHTIGSGSYRVYKNALKNAPNTSVKGKFPDWAIEDNEGLYYTGSGENIVYRTPLQMKRKFESDMTPYLRIYDIKNSRVDISNHCMSTKPDINLENPEVLTADYHTRQARARRGREKVAQNVSGAFQSVMSMFPNDTKNEVSPSKRHEFGFDDFKNLALSADDADRKEAEDILTHNGIDQEDAKNFVANYKAKHLELAIADIEWPLTKIKKAGGVVPTQTLEFATELVQFLKVDTSVNKWTQDNQTRLTRLEDAVQAQEAATAYAGEYYQWRASFTPETNIASAQAPAP